MRRECIELLTEGNREIEFSYREKKYSITYFRENGKKLISFCEFYKTPIDVTDANELLKIEVNGITLEKIFSELPDSAFSIY